MSEWTDAAKQAFEEHLARLRPSLAATGADFIEVADDLKRHVETEAASEQLKIITDQDARRILARIGPVPEQMPSPPMKLARNVSDWNSWRTGVAVLFGTLLPLGTLIAEMRTHMCGGTFFDPIPTWWHIVLVALVPVANTAAVVLLQRHRDNARAAAWVWVLNGFAVGIALLYSVLFLPLMPFAAIGIIMFGLGFLPLAPSLALIVALVFRRHLGHLAGERVVLPASRWWGGFGAAVLVLGALALPTPLTRHWERMAASEDAETSLKGVQQLRRFGHRETLLADCYGVTSWERDNPWNFSLAGTPAPTEKCRVLYFRVTGDVFNSVRPPQAGFDRGGWSYLSELDWDSGLGADAVGGRVTGLSMIQSRLDGLANADAGHAYVEWTMEFKNEHQWQAREARAQLQLPPGGVVSRLTLWVNGEEREAAFAGRGETRAAYQKVAIQQRRDPVLVTTCGPDRVLMQCFPVPANGGTMKVRVGITVPMILTRTNESVLKWPCLAERNFRLRDNLPHLIWLESAQKPIRFPSPLAAGIPKPDTHSVRGTISDASLSSADSLVSFARASATNDALATDRVAHDGATIRRRIEQVAPSKPSRLIMVVDCSKGAASAMEEIAQAVSKVPEETEFSILVAEDGVREEVGNGRGPKHRELAMERLRKLAPHSGHDNAPALVKGLDRGINQPGTVVLWFHDTQPLLLESTAELQQQLDWRPGAALPEILDFQFRAGPNRVAEMLDSLRVTTVPRLGTVRADLERLFGQWTGSEPVFRVTWEREISRTGTNESAVGSRHLARLWALGQTQRLAAGRDLKAAQEIAVRYQLVTPVSGAVVLETKEQYQAAGLQPADPMTVPMVPEPSTWALLGLGAVAWYFVRKRKAKGAR